MESSDNFDNAGLFVGFVLLISFANKVSIKLEYIFFKAKIDNR